MQCSFAKDHKRFAESFARHRVGLGCRSQRQTFRREGLHCLGLCLQSPDIGVWSPLVCTMPGGLAPCGATPTSIIDPLPQIDGEGWTNLAV